MKITFEYVARSECLFEKSRDENRRIHPQFKNGNTLSNCHSPGRDDHSSSGRNYFRTSRRSAPVYSGYQSEKRASASAALRGAPNRWPLRMGFIDDNAVPFIARLTIANTESAYKPHIGRIPGKQTCRSVTQQKKRPRKIRKFLGLFLVYSRISCNANWGFPREL